ncbi:MAG: Rrf2 family transcriptional regulator [Candidatus Omnitrophica bacterium]|nr:Rrf2 family transcriptional regulator [Candidatus Omnitrophota bacterium]
MQITYRGDYSLKTILFLSFHHNRDVITIHELAKKLDIPIKFLEQVLLGLKRGGFVDSKRGVNGGYYLLKQPKDIRVGDVIRFIDGPIEPIACANRNKAYKGCKDIYNCVFRDIWIKVTIANSEIVDNITFEDLCNKIKNVENINYYI